MYNCAIWHLKDAHGELDTDDLADIQLFVIPVTKKLLSEPNRASEIEIPFAIENNVAILPIIVENDDSLFNLFNSMWEGMQALNRYDTDTSADPYALKLQKYLDQVLLNDETIVDVRKNAFSSQLFLSYRKKDRKHARTLMRLIHQNENNSSVGIWYDEFLTPGENFNSEIAKEIKECDVFTLAVTPNLLEKGNYVHTEEFKLAKEIDKPMFSAEMVKTDRKSLADMYEGIGEISDSENTDAFYGDLSSKLSQADSRGERNSENDFYLGLAYLNGINIETNSDKAVNILTRVAEANDTASDMAMMELIRIYEAGKGVKRDYRKAFDWKCLLLERKRAEVDLSLLCDDIPFSEVAQHYLISLMDCFASYDTLSDKESLDKLDNIWSDNIDFARTLPYVSQKGFLSFGRAISDAINKAISSGANNEKVPINFDSKARPYDLDGADVELGSLLSKVIIAYASICDRKGDVKRAIKLNNEAVEIAKDFYNKYNDIRCAVNLAVTYVMSGHTLQKSDKKAAKKQYINAYDLCIGLVPKNPTENEQLNGTKVNVCLSLAQLLTSTGSSRNDQDECKDWIERARKIANECEDEAFKSKTEAFICSLEGDLYSLQGNNDEAMKKYEQSRQLREKIVQNTDEFHSKRVEIYDLIQMGKASFDANPNKCAEAADYFRKAINKCEEILSQSDSPRTLRDMATAYLCLGESTYKGNPKNGIKQLEKCIKITEDLPTEETLEDLERLLKAYTVLHVIHADCTRNRKGITSALENVVKISERILATCPKHSDARIAKEKSTKLLRMLSR